MERKRNDDELPGGRICTKSFFLKKFQKLSRFFVLEIEFLLFRKYVGSTNTSYKTPRCFKGGVGSTFLEKSLKGVKFTKIKNKLVD
jgi:hypothetical protein